MISKKSFLNLMPKHKKKIIVYLILYVLFGGLIYAALLPNVKPNKVDVQLFSIADKTIRAPRNIEDKAVTERKKNEAYARVEDQYKFHSEYKQNRMDIVTSLFDAVNQINDSVNPALVPQPVAGNTVSDAEKIKKVREKIHPDLSRVMSDPTLLAFLSAPKEQLAIARDYTLTSINTLMGNQIMLNQVDKYKQQIAEDLVNANVSVNLKDAISIVGKYAIIANTFYDSEATTAMRKSEMDKVDPVYILDGQIIVKEGDTITNEVYNQLELAGLLNSAAAYQSYIGLFLLVGLMLYFIYHQFKSLGLSRKRGRPYLLVYVIIMSLTLGIMKGVSLLQGYGNIEIGYIVPIAMGTMLVYLLIHKRFIFITSVILSIWGSILFNGGNAGTFNFSIGIYILLSSLAVTIFWSGNKRSTMLLRAGGLIGVFNIVILISVLLLKNGNYSPGEFGLYILMAIGSGVISSILTMGVIPYLEDAFGMISSLKLMDLSNPTHPLLRKILLEAPGTYHHSIMVANLAEGACEAIGANGLVARVGAYYHDIGKTVRPQYFIENQMNIPNPHDSLSPIESKNIIISHVTDGVRLLRENRMPVEIIDIAAQHHGTTFLKFFYYKAKEKNPSVTENDFRYPGPKANSKESAIVGISDSVEAAVRAMSLPTQEKIAALVKSIIQDRLQDGQFSECDLTFRELELIQQSLCETLNGTFHSRIQYPEPIKKEVVS